MNVHVATIVVLSGLYLIWREDIAKKRAAAEAIAAASAAAHRRRY